jgi:predicted MFS family arabinose efflux permease
MMPFLLFGPFIGTVATRYSYRRLIIVSQVVNALILGIFAILALLEVLQFWQVAFGSFLIGLGGAFDWPSRRALIPDLVGKSRTVDAMVLENIPQNISRVFGPFLSGILLELLDIQGCFPILFGLYVVELIILLQLSNATDTIGHASNSTSPWADLREGLRYAWGSHWIMGVLAITLFMNAFTFPYQTLLPVFARDILQRGPIELGILGACIGIGSFIGIVPVNWMKRYQRNGWVFAGSSLIASASIMVFALSTSYPLSIVMLIISGIGQSGFSVMQSSIILQSTSDAMRARVMGTLVLAIGGGPLGRLQIGGLSTILGVPLALCLSSVVAAVGTIGVLFKNPKFRGHDGENIEK